MAPVVHGLESQYKDRLDFVYLNIADPRTDSAKKALGFRATPHFFFASAKGEIHDSMQGVVPADSVRGAIERLIASGR